MTSALLLAATAFLLVASVRYKNGALLAVAVGLVIHYTYQSLVLGFEADEPYHAHLFLSEDRALFQQIDLVLVMWVFIVLWMSSVSRRIRDPIDQSPTPTPILPRLWPIAVVVVTSTVLLIASKGGFAATQRFVRLGDGGQGGTGVFLAAPAVLLVASIIRFRASPPQSRGQVVSMAGMVLAGGVFFVLGSRTPVIAAIASFLLAALLRMVERKAISMRVVAVVAIVAIMLPAFVVALRTQRDAMLTEGSNADQNTSFSEAINAHYYEALSLAVRDSGERYEAPGPGLFPMQSLGIVPRAIWDEKPQFISVGKWLRRQYEPQAINGWPPGAPGDWYLTLGLVGVVVGAALTGVVANLLDRRGQKMGSLSAARANFELSLFWGFVVLPGGIDSEIAARTILWVVLPLLYVRFFSMPANSIERLGVAG